MISIHNIKQKIMYFSVCFIISDENKKKLSFLCLKQYIYSVKKAVMLIDRGMLKKPINWKRIAVRHRLIKTEIVVILKGIVGFSLAKK